MCSSRLWAKQEMMRQCGWCWCRFWHRTTARRTTGRPRRIGCDAARHSAERCGITSPVDASSDLYGLGVLLYLALTGEYPFDSDDLDPFPYLHRHAGHSTSSSDRSSVAGPATDEVALRALAKAPSARFATGAALSRSGCIQRCRLTRQLDRRARDEQRSARDCTSRGNWQSPSYSSADRDGGNTWRGPNTSTTSLPHLTRGRQQCSPSLACRARGNQRGTHIARD